MAEGEVSWCEKPPQQARGEARRLAARRPVRQLNLPHQVRMEGGALVCARCGRKARSLPARARAR
eukprot:4114622-Lingulodinium_polyedra.AAC.1